MEETIRSSAVTTEAKFDINELFFSITNTDSTILSGNEVFVRISGYRREELIGKYHNVVRHPDMPRIVFKLLWDYLNAGKPIVAYVKNKTKEGGYYWVLAAVFPLHDHYISIRIKPTTELFTAAKELYVNLLTAERKGGMEESGTIIPDLLDGLGYEDYNHFMSAALLQELQERQKLVSLPSSGDVAIESDTLLSRQLKSAQGYTKRLMQEYDAWFAKINMFIHVKSMFEEKSLVLREVAREIVFLSLNASVSSYKIASGGETFGILASDIRINAKENDSLIGQIDTLVHSLTDSLNAIIFSISGIRLQTETLIYFIKELLCENCNVQRDELGDNMDLLVALVEEYSGKSNTLQSQIDRQLQEILKYLDQLEQQMMYLGYIQVYGMIEAAGYRNEAVSFDGIFLQLKTLIHQTSQEIDVMQKMGKSFYTENRLLMEKSQEIGILLNRLRENMVAIKKMEE